MGKDVLYEAMKVAAKRRNIKASPEHDLYKKNEPYFYHVFYHFDFAHPCKTETGVIHIILDIAVKYCRFDELRWNIISPGNDLKFTDKVRANSIAACDASFPRKSLSFRYDGSKDGLCRLCEDILNWLEKFYRDFFKSIEKDYGTLELYQVAGATASPRYNYFCYSSKKNSSF